MNDNSFGLVVKNLVFEFKNFALNIEEFKLQKGKITILLGKNGAGKTTFLNVLGDYYRPKKEFEKKLNGHIAYVHEQPNFFPTLKVQELIDFLREKSPLDSSEFQNILENLGLKKQGNFYCGTLSKGSKLKLSLFTSFVLKRDIYIFDEPFSGVDVIGVQEIKKILLSLKNNSYSVLISTHLLDAVKDLVDEIYLLDNGKIISYLSELQVQDLIKDNQLDEYVFRSLKAI